jgi:cyclopropane fatty-acyl-phospholipid synthase-like methyltransferase
MNQYLSQLYATDTYSHNTGGWLPNEDEAKAATVLRVLRKARVLEGVNSILDVGCCVGGILRRVHAQLTPGVRGLGIGNR